MPTPNLSRRSFLALAGAGAVSTIAWPAWAADARRPGAVRAPLPVARLDLAALGRLTFRAPCETRWPALALARQVIAAGGAAGAVLNAAKEQALDDFIAGRIRFTDMAPAVAHALDRAAGRAGFAVSPDSLEAVMAWDAQARRDAAAWSFAA